LLVRRLLCIGVLGRLLSIRVLFLGCLLSPKEAASVAVVVAIRLLAESHLLHGDEWGCADGGGAGPGY
jgi:hypothetical protein